MARHLDAARPLIERGQFYTFLIQLDEEQGYDEKVLVYLRQLAALPLSERFPCTWNFAICRGTPIRFCRRCRVTG